MSILGVNAVLSGAFQYANRWTIVKRMDTFLCNLFLRAAA